MKFICFPALVAGSMLFVVNLAQAQTATGSLGVTAEVTRTCTLSSSTLAFGELNTAAVNTANSLITLVCNGASTVTTVTVGMGDNADTGTQRKMISGTDVVPYTLHVLETDNTDILTDGAITLVKETDSNTYNATIYGKIVASTDYQMGSYSDTVVLTAVYAP
jgi:spore coat protein U-like protein